MKVYISHSRGFDFQVQLYQPIKESDLAVAHSFFLPHDGGRESGVDAKNILKGSDILVAEVSFPSTGQGIELGWADTLGIPVVCMYRKDAKFSGSLVSVCTDFVSYTDSEDLISKLKEILAKK